MNLEQKIEALEKISSGLEPNSEERKIGLKEISILTEDFIENTEKRKSYFPGNPDYSKFEITDEPKDLKGLNKVYQKEVIEYGINPASGGHIGYIPGGGIYLSALGDYLAAVSNEYAGMYYGSPGAVSMENACLNWIKKQFSFPENAVGNLCSGGSIANLIALNAARDAKKIKKDKIEKSVIYLSPQVHHCLHKAIRILGLEDIQIRELKLNSRHRIDLKFAEEQIKADIEKQLEPFLLIGSAGTTDTGAIDPLSDLADLCHEKDMWFHVDGAYGGFFILCDEKKELFKGIEKADSLVVDPHKSLFLPYGTGAVLVKNKEAVFHSNHYTANYMQDALEPNQINPADLSPELTKHFRGLRMWLPLQYHGIEPFKACLSEKLLLTEYFRQELGKMGFEVGPPPDLSVSFFWFPKAEKQDEFNQELMRRIHQDGRVFLSSSRIDDKFVIRMAILSFRTKKATIDKCIKMISEIIEEMNHDAAH